GIRAALIAVGALLPVLTALLWMRLRAIDSHVTVPTTLIELLRANEIFGPLPPPAVEHLCGRRRSRALRGRVLAGRRRRREPRREARERARRARRADRGRAQRASRAERGCLEPAAARRSGAARRRGRCTPLRAPVDGRRARLLPRSHPPLPPPGPDFEAARRGLSAGRSR